MIQISPANSNGGEFEGISERTKNDKIITNGPVNFVHTGMTKAVYSFGTSAPMEQKYSYWWRQPATLSGQLILTHDGPQSAYIPYFYSGLAISRINSAKDDVSRFDPLYLLPAEWEVFVPFAFSIQQANLEVFKFSGKKITEENTSKLRNFARDRNPLISIAAVHRILQQRKIDSSLTPDLKSIQNLALESDGFKQAVLLSLALQWSTEKEKKEITSFVQSAVKEISVSENLLWLAFGAFATRESEMSKRRSLDWQTLQSAENILTSIALKRRTMESQRDVDKYVDAIVRASGIVQNPPDPVDFKLNQPAIPQ